MLLLFVATTSRSQYQLRIVPSSEDSLTIYKGLGLQASFPSRQACSGYIENLPNTLLFKGFPSASIDSVYYDSTFATLFLYVGKKLQVTSLNMSAADQKLLEQSQWSTLTQKAKPLPLGDMKDLQSGILGFLESTGYPFARVKLDSIVFNEESMSATLIIDEGPLYKIDSIRVYGDVKIANMFLQRYLDLPNGSIYKKETLQNISRKLSALPFLQEQQSWNMTMLGTGSILNLYLQSKKSSQVNVLAGFLPSNQQLASNKLLVTGEANINLRNAFGNGETIGLNWQQIQVRSPRLNLAFRQPFLFSSPFGINTTFDLFKKDSSFLNLSFLAAVEYAASANQEISIFLQNLTTNLLNVDTNLVKLSRKLPNERDVRSIHLGVQYLLNTTNYRYNPKRGTEISLTASAGTRKLRRNNVIIKLISPDFSYASLYDTVKESSYQVRLKLIASHYFQLSSQSTLKSAINSGWIQSPSLFRNELFQIGGYRLLRGFDEESIFASRYAVATAEYRYLIGINSFLFTFLDAGWASNTSNDLGLNNFFLGGGLGMALETKAGVFNISYAAGKRDDLKFNLRQSKIHVGYVNYF